MGQPIVEPEQQTISIVVLGDFNPSIFQPLWFSANDLMPREETDAAEITVIHKKVAAFSMGKMQVQVDEAKLGLTTAESPQAPVLRDLTFGTLSILEHTPLKAIGLNLDSVFVMDSEEAWHSIGDTMVPKEHWCQIMEKPGMTQVIVEGKRTGCTADRVQIRIQPAGSRRVLVAINQHYQLDTVDRKDVRDRNKEAIRVLRDDWTPFLIYARDSASCLITPHSTTEPKAPA